MSKSQVVNVLEPFSRTGTAFPEAMAHGVVWIPATEERTAVLTVATAQPASHSLCAIQPGTYGPQIPPVTTEKTVSD